MDLELLEKGLDYAKKKRKWVFLAGVTCFGAYKVYNFPSLVKKRHQLSKLFQALVSVAEMVTDSADAIGIVSRDLKHFLGSQHSDQIPHSLKQLSRIAKSDEFSDTLTSITRASAVGILSGCHSSGGDHGFSDKIFSDAGKGLASAVAGSFARNMVVALLSEWQRGTDSDGLPRWIEVACDDKCRDLVGDFIRLFVSSAVTVYSKPDDVCECGFSGDEKVSSIRAKLIPLQKKRSTDKNQESGLTRTVRSTLAVPGNRRFVLDMTGVVTFETVRSFLEFLLEKMAEGVKTSVDVVQQEVVEKGVEAIRYASGRSSAVTAVCLTLCLNILNSPWILTTY